MDMKLELRENKEAVATRAAELLSEVMVEDGEKCIALAGGTTPKLLYSLLAAEPFASNLPWERLRWFFGDERFVASDHEDSNFRMAKETLFGPAGVENDKIHRVRTELGDPELAAADYQQQLEAVVTKREQGVPVFDVILLGMGADGHTASLFPHTSALAETERFVAPNFVPLMDTWRVTLTPAILLAATTVFVLVTGGEKSAALAAVLEGPENVNTYPSQLLRRRTKATAWLVDKAAAAELTFRE